MIGCSHFIDTGQTLSHRVRGETEQTAAAPSNAPAAHVPEPARPLPPMPEAKVVNIFGEMDGASPPANKVAGDAGFQQHTFTDEGGDSDVAVDPTGKWIAFASTRHSGRSDIYLQRVDGTAVTQLTSDAADDAYPAFSPDGKQIAFASTRAGAWQIYLMDTDGRNVVQVTSGTMQAIHPSFSPDGARLVYSAIGSRSNQWELWTANLQTNEKRMIAYGLFPTWSPDKKSDRIAYQRARQRGGRWFSLWTLDLIDGEARRLTEVAASTNAAIVSPTWSPDGRRLAFATVVAPAASAAPQAKAKSPVAHGQQDIWTIDADGSNRQRLTDGNGTNLSPAWASNNRVFFISDRGGNESIWSVHAASVVDPAQAAVQAPLVAPEPAATAPGPAAPSGAAADAHEPEH
jgi:TolB protein